ncbi:hypothetical protein K933_05283 [Candidatus Halobonum tyrrellensis G22]|uniref:Uncharacterized protein n=1 Tax=Candidatus Halobonum tyrrellensis G22 TaxID=1324957 RepID=V4GVI2_9EURY|nr:hypothetical protein K933_05283 [Candidatus Halobonum tyrrellensis G22]
MGHAVCGLAGLVVAAAALVVGWSVVLAATAWVPFLSTTALVAVTAVVWAVAWLAFESALLLSRRPRAGSSNR